MAEERLIDDDKDRKYRIRKNADGEDELVVIDPAEDGDEESDIPVFNVPVYDDDDEEAAVLTPEQFAERERKKREESEVRGQKVASLISKTKEKLEEGDFEGALYNISQAELLAADNGEVYYLKLKALSRNLTDFISSKECAKAADGVAKYCNGEQKAELKANSSILESRLAQAQARCAELDSENEEGKAERRGVFAAAKSRTLKVFLLCAIPFAVFLVLAAVFGSMMYSDENGVYLVVAIVFIALTAITFICTVIATNRLLTAMRNVRLNESNSSTKIGREYLQTQAEAENLKQILQSFENDLS